MHMLHIIDFLPKELSSYLKMEMHTLLKVFIMYIGLNNGEILFKNHNYNNLFGNRRQAFHLSIDKMKDEIMKKRHNQLIEFTMEANNNNYPPDQVIDYTNIIGTIPNNFMKKFNDTKTPYFSLEESEDNVQAAGEIHEVQVLPEAGLGEEAFGHDTSFLPYDHSLLDSFDSKDYQRVNVQVFRGPNTKYTSKHHLKQYAPWGYFVSQPVGHNHLDFTDFHHDFQFNNW